MRSSSRADLNTDKQSVKLFSTFKLVFILKISILGDCGQHNRRITFLTPTRGFYLEGHVISNHSVELNLDCQDQCALARECVSYNIGPMINTKMACELSNSDHLQHPEDLKPRKDWTYRGTEVFIPSQMNFEPFHHSGGFMMILSQ